MLVTRLLSAELLESTIAAFFFFLMIRRPPRSTLDRSSAASDVYKRQAMCCAPWAARTNWPTAPFAFPWDGFPPRRRWTTPVSYTHLRAHETVLDLVCRLLLENKNTTHHSTHLTSHRHYIAPTYISPQITRTREYIALYIHYN